MSEPARKDLAHVQGAQVVTADAGSLMAVIGRAASDPNTDVDKLERLMGLYERITDRSAEQAFHEAMNAAQEAMRPVAADANNPQTKSKYASYAALDRALRPIYTKHGFSLSFDTADGAPSDHVRVVCEVAHRDGHKRRPHLDMPADGKGAKGGDVMTKTHAIGAAVTYGKRYLLGMVFNIAVGEDDDGNSNGGSGREFSEAAKRAIEEINAIDDPAGLVLWKKNKSAGVMNVVSDAEGREIVALWNRRAAAMKGEDNG
jgi:hypothetical protein